ncbi:hypothetical protein COCC4DRAFT_44940 [Bipolaris maydis ATCC 48331]|uniref:DUF1917 domain-containing protein n=1 Tax=Cochliobolus heterostrophus (strain C4 / ATCC 48331 / race T) TaxID=665024 RepID=N4WHL4_COCH4|nr:uncharacterized protein COCC4DRAFT_44940 [Bipolaris maydis ATCC 48331]KAJ5056775.1 hypothetical protein J3E74DRAFT_410506 [Bipolaris maydis]ENH99823.1 hypothetical protein COCC4DRAFT_44940 [Bipolaris maydis ATCC 48331]KAJ6196362.1 hypothetical protein J3E72DRAFT_376364 [Bipolaris maydis]KAJ6208468.1 hypothetical protein PSV09DRAFT_2401152 [Bipolaris maydis]KAJ6270445.1 hypothetical protein PSV08DRAFT_352391 [Bipolaris maydis]
MEEEDMVSGDGWISDDSSFYGTEEEQQHQNQHYEKHGIKSFWRAHSNDINVIMMDARAQLLAKPTSDDSAAPSKRGKRGTSPVTQDQTCKTPSCYHKDLAQEQLLTSNNRKQESPSEKSSELELFNRLQGQRDAWQLGESVDDFIRRLPPLTTSMSTCPWIWAENPFRNPHEKPPCPHAADFTNRGMRLLQESLEIRRKIHELGATQPKGSVTKQLTQESKYLQERIASLASDTHVLSGKWMLFPKSVDVTRVWKQIVAGVIENRLGSGCKVATDSGKEERLICVYSKDFRDTQDVVRVLRELETMGLLSAARPIYYKPDAYTYLDLRRENAAEYGLQASLYNSRSMLANSKETESASLTQKE